MGEVIIGLVINIKSGGTSGQFNTFWRYSKFAPNTKEQIKPSIDKINKVRKADVSKSTYVRLSDYDEKRAEKAIKDIQKKAAEKNMKKNVAKKPVK